jgi:hypothetical protein
MGRTGPRRIDTGPDLFLQRGASPHIVRRMRRTWPVLLALALLAPACKSEAEKRCESYVEMQIQCGEDAGITNDEKEALRLMVGGMCRAALEGTLASGGDNSGMLKEMQANIRAEVQCQEAATSKSCDEWKRCERN